MHKNIWRSDVDWKPLESTIYGGAKMMITESVEVDVSQDWVTACGLQERFMAMPYAKPQGLTYDGRCRQIKALGGDCFHFVPLPGGRIGLAVVDASGKGLPAAL